MSEEQNNTVDIFQDLGNIDFSNIDTSMPVLAPGLYQCKVTNVERHVSQNSGKPSLHISLALEQSAVDITGEKEIHPGYRLDNYIGLVPSEKFDPKVQIAKFLKALEMDDQPFESSNYIGQSIMVRTKVDEGSEEFGARVSVAGFVKAQ